MGRWLALATCWLGLTVCLWAGGVRYGMSREQVEAALGKPIAELVRGPRLILRYPRNGTVEIEKGVVVRLSGVPVDDGTPTTTTPQSATFTLDELTAAEPARAVNVPRMGTQDLVAVTKRMEENRDRQLLALVPGPPQFWSALAAGLLIRALVTVAVLKFAFKWSDVHAEWLQMIIPALADTLSQAGISAGVYALWHTNQLFNVDVAVSYFVLIGVLMKTTHACTLQRAVAVATAAKFASFVTWILISAALLNLLAGSGKP